MMSAMRNNAKLIFRAKKKRIGSCTKGFFFFTSYKFKKKTEKMFVSSEVSYFTLYYVTTRN